MSFGIYILKSTEILKPHWTEMLTRSQAKTKAVAKNKTKTAKRKAMKSTVDKKWFANLPQMVNANGYVLPAGEYFIGDLEKTLSRSDWTEVYELLKATVQVKSITQGRFVLTSGREVIMVASNGIFCTDSEHGRYTVESGTIGVTLRHGLGSVVNKGGRVFDWSGDVGGIGLLVGNPADQVRDPVIVFSGGLIIDLQRAFLPTISDLVAWGGFGHHSRFIVF
jgi:hypothetical protein